SELLSVSETGLFSFARNWLRTLGVPYLRSGLAVCCRRRLQQAHMASSAPRTLSARCSTPRRHCAYRSSVLLWRTGQRTTESFRGSHAWPAPSITAKLLTKSRSSCAGSRGGEHRERSTSE